MKWILTILVFISINKQTETQAAEVIEEIDGKLVSRAMTEEEIRIDNLSRVIKEGYVNFASKSGVKGGCKIELVLHEDRYKTIRKEGEEKTCDIASFYFQNTDQSKEVKNEPIMSHIILHLGEIGKQKNYIK